MTTNNNSVYYDNLFTSNLFTGTTNGLDLTNYLTSRLWSTLNIDRQYPNINSPKGNFFVIKTFSYADSDTIVKAIANKIDRTVFFDQFGNLLIYNSTLSKLIDFINVTAFGGTNRNYDSPDGLIDLKNIPNSKLILSDQNTYILSLLIPSQVQILYNPIHRSSMKDFYNSLSSNLNGYNTPNSSNTDDIQKLVDKYCEMMAVTKTENGDRHYADSLCKCLGTDSSKSWLSPSTSISDPVGECIDDSIGHITNSTIRDKTGLNCVCIAPSCTANRPTNSFTNDFISKVKNSLTCPDINTTFCNTMVDAGIKYNNTTTKLSQLCANNENYITAISTPAPTTPAPTTIVTETPVPTTTPPPPIITIAPITPVPTTTPPPIITIAPITPTPTTLPPIITITPVPTTPVPTTPVPTTPVPTRTSIPITTISPVPTSTTEPPLPEIPTSILVFGVACVFIIMIGLFAIIRK